VSFRAEARSAAGEESQSSLVERPPCQDDGDSSPLRLRRSARNDNRRTLAANTVAGLSASRQGGDLTIDSVRARGRSHPTRRVEPSGSRFARGGASAVVINAARPPGRIYID